MSARPVHVDPTAVIDERVLLGEGCKIWHFCHVSAGAQLGEGCILGQNVYVGPDVRIGARVKIQNNVSVYSGVVLEDDVFVGPSVVFTNVKNPRAFVDQSDSFATTHVGRGATVGANATVVCGVRLGEYCFVAAGAVVTRDVPAFAVVLGNPARVVGSVDRGGQVQKAREADGDVGVKMLDPAAENAAFSLEIERRAAEVLRSGAYVLGPYVEEFEAACAEFLGVPHAVGVSSGSDALLLALIAAGVDRGDEVITSPFSFVSGVEAILRLGAVPRFVDISSSSYHVDPEVVLGQLTPRTKAFIPVHLFGRAVDLSLVRPEFEKRGVPIIEDAAQAFGARCDRGLVGAAAWASCFSFFPSKNLGGFGDGGLITTGDAQVAERLRQLRVHGASRKYHHVEVGGNYRLDALQAALLCLKLRHVPELLARRQDNARVYLSLLSELELSKTRLTLPAPGPYGHTYNQFVIATDRRDELREYLRNKGIETAVYYPEPLHLQPLLDEHRCPLGRFPASEAACQRALALPVHPALGEGEVRRICSEIARFFGRTVTW